MTKDKSRDIYGVDIVYPGTSPIVLERFYSPS